LRIAAGVAQGLASGSGRPVLPVSNLAAVAASAGRRASAGRVLACMDARMGQVYWATFDCTGAAPATIGEERLSAPEAVTVPGGDAWFGAGHGFAAYPGIAARLGTALAGLDPGALPRAGDIARIAAADFAAGRALPAAQGLPVYLRDEVVHKR
jgi:tRNA threonylcarbamoyladenosine biosynthesis protein TsaB